MTVQELIDHLSKVPPEHRSAIVKVWLPGSTIRLSPMEPKPIQLKRHEQPFVGLEGNVDEGSALSYDADSVGWR